MDRGGAQGERKEQALGIGDERNRERWDEIGKEQIVIEE